MITTIEYLPDEILLIICNYLSQYHIIHAFFNLNDRLNSTISQYYNSLIVDHNVYRELLPIIGSYLQSLTIKDISLKSHEISLASNIQELTFDKQHPQSIPSLVNLTDLNIINAPSTNLTDVLFLTNNNIHSIYISSQTPLTISTTKISKIKQLGVTLRSLDDCISLFSICPELTCLNLHLLNCNFKNIPKQINEPSNLQIFSLRTNYETNVDFNTIKNIFQYLPSQLEYLGIEIITLDRECVNGQTWENYLKEKFPNLIRLDFFIYLRPELPTNTETRRLPSILKTFQSDYWSSITPQHITGYYDRSYQGESISIHTEPAPIVRRRRYFLN
ncbi:unnamed protein product [Adineta steineri]|uniref:F-box domain-containing protein n=1 Tax=Adineta steineri TaxID=433720 RepID=A0A819JJP1_9BILA|nr:unnamed protein product [Adineta steineri]CAF3928737.1 unnamed protein product [Adineta steineri]